MFGLVIQDCIPRATSDSASIQTTGSLSDLLQPNTRPSPPTHRFVRTISVHNGPDGVLGLNQSQTQHPTQYSPYYTCRPTTNYTFLAIPLARTRTPIHTHLHYTKHIEHKPSDPPLHRPSSSPSAPPRCATPRCAIPPCVFSTTLRYCTQSLTRFKIRKQECSLARGSLPCS
jgi:hypothetical protein